MYNILRFNKNMMQITKVTLVHTYCAKVNGSELKTMKYTKVSVKWQMYYDMMK